MAVRTSTTTAVIKWKPLSLKESGGFMTGYNAVILESSDEECITTTNFREIDVADTQILLNELKPFKAYCISIACKTAKGIGKYSNITSIHCKNLYASCVVLLFNFISFRTSGFLCLYD